MVFGIKVNLFTYTISMLLEMLVQVGNFSGLYFSITQSLCGLQEHACVYSLDMSTVKTKHISPSSCPSICLFSLISMTFSGYIFVKYDIGAFFNICEENWNLINIGQKYWRFT